MAFDDLLTFQWSATVVCMCVYLCSCACACTLVHTFSCAIAFTMNAIFGLNKAIHPRWNSSWIGLRSNASLASIHTYIVRQNLSHSNTHTHTQTHQRTILTTDNNVKSVEQRYVYLWMEIYHAIFSKVEMRLFSLLLRVNLKKEMIFEIVCFIYKTKFRFIRPLYVR